MKASMNLIRWQDLFFTNWNAFRKTGDKLEWRGFNFEIIDMDGHRIDKVLVTASKEIKDEMEE